MNQLSPYFENVQALLMVMTKILGSVRQNIHSSLETVGSSLINMQKQIEKEAAESTANLENAFLKSGELLILELDQAQAQVDDVFELAAAEQFKDCDSAPEISLKGSEFTKSIEAMSLLNDTLTAELFRLMGTLSEEDVIVQRLESSALLCESFLVYFEKYCIKSVPVDMKSARMLREKARTFFRSTEERLIMTRSGLDEAIPEKPLKTNAADFFVFCQRYFTMLAMLNDELLAIYTRTLEKTNNSVLHMAALASGCVDHAQMRMMKTENGFINTKVSNHDFWMKNLENASEALTQSIFTLMGILSEGDVCCQRLSVLSRIAKRLANYSDLMANDFGTAQQGEILRSDILSLFVTEEDKQIYRTTLSKRQPVSA